LFASDVFSTFRAARVRPETGDGAEREMKDGRDQGRGDVGIVILSDDLIIFSRLACLRSNLGWKGWDKE